MNKYGGLIFAVWLASFSPLAWSADASTTPDQASTPQAATQGDATQGAGTTSTAQSGSTTQSSGSAAGGATSNGSTSTNTTAAGSAPASTSGAATSGQSGTTTAQGSGAATGTAASGTEAARNALKQKSTDVSSEKNLEQVFEAAQKQYSLLKSGGMDMTLSGSYTYYANQSIDIHFNNSGSLDRFRILNTSQHTFGAAMSFDYGIWDNLTFNTYLPVVYQYDTTKQISKAALGDVSFGLRYQPFPVVSGGTNTTLFGTLSTATGDSPYKINPNTEVASGKGYYSLGGGLSMSRVIDPVVLFGSLGYTFAFNAGGLNQAQSSRILTDVHPGDSVSLSFGMAYALSYDVSFSGSYQQSYNFPSRYFFQDGTQVESADSTTGIMNMSLGLRTTSNRIVNLSFGFGLTPGAPNVVMGVSVPVDISGLKSGS